MIRTENLEADSASGHKPRVFLDDNESGRFYSGFHLVVFKFFIGFLDLRRDRRQMRVGAVGKI